MKKLNNVIIIGCNISSLYAAIKLLDLGYKVTIIEKKHSYLPVYDRVYHNFKIYNDNHKVYISLLRRFEIKPDKINIKIDDCLISLINTILVKSKPIPNNILMTHTFASLFKSLLSETEYDALISYENIFSGIFNVINAMDCINLFTNDIGCANVNYYKISMQSVNELINKMLSYIHNKNGRIIYNNEVKTIKYMKQKFVIGTNAHITLTSDMLLTTISRDNLLLFNFWNNEQRLMFNTVSCINLSIINNIIEYFTLTSVSGNSDETRSVLLDKLHIVYPLHTNKSKHVYIWNNGVNNVLIRERMKCMYNDKFFICSESYSKNNMFINYSLESIDNALLKLVK